MAARARSPIIFPLSNPTSKSEATPADVLRWTRGQALIATGSPFGSVDIAGTTRQVGQANNVFIFPGVGLGAIVAQAREVTDSMFLAAAGTLASLVTSDRLSAGALYPRLADLRDVSRAIAVAVAEQAFECGVAGLEAHEDVAAAVDAAMWTPDYPRPSAHGAAAQQGSFS
jgi:malic enzyme